MFTRSRLRTLTLTVSGALLGAAATVAGPMVNVPAGSGSYRNSVRCMPEVRDRSTFDASLENQEDHLVTIDLRASIDGDPKPDVLLFGADTYRESVACTARLRGLLGSLGADPDDLPAFELEEQEEIPERELPEDARDTQGTE